MSDAFWISLAGIITALTSLVIAIKSKSESKSAKMTSGYAADDARHAIKLAYEAKKEM